MWSYVKSGLCGLATLTGLVAQPGYISTVAGGFPQEGPAQRVALSQPGGLHFDSRGNLRIAQVLRLSEVTPDGTVRNVVVNHGRACRNAPTSYLGEPGVGQGVDTFSLPVSLPDGSILFRAACASSGIRKVWPDGRITTIAPLAGFGGILPEPSGHILVADTAGNRIVRISPDGAISPYAGTGVAGFSGDGGPASNARLNGPVAIVADSGGNVWIGDNGNRRVRMVARDGTIGTVAGDGTLGYAGDGRPATESPLGYVTQMAAHPDGSVLLADSIARRVLKVWLDGRLESVVGNGLARPPTLGARATDTSILVPQGIAIHPQSGDLFVSDRQAGQVYRISSDGILNLHVGVDPFWGEGGPAAYSRLNLVLDAAWNANGNLLVLEAYTNLLSNVRLIDPQGNLRTLALLNGYFRSIAISPEAQIYVADATSVRRLERDGNLSIVAGQSSSGFAVEDGLARNALFNDIRRITFAKDGTLYLADGGNHRIRAISPDGLIRTVAGTGVAGFSGDGGPANRARLNYPVGVAVDRTGNVLIADINNCRVRRVLLGGSIETFAGTGTCRAPVDFALARSSPILGPSSVVEDSDGGILIIGDWSFVWRVSPEGRIVRIAGSSDSRATGDGGPAQAANLSADSLILDQNRNIFLCDVQSSSIRKIQGPAPFQVSPAGATFQFSPGTIPEAANLTLRTSLGEARQYIVEASDPWVNVTPRRGLVSPSGETIRVTVSPSLTRGVYATKLKVVDPLNGLAQTVPISVTVGRTPQQLRLSQTGVTFGSRMGVTDTSATQTIRVLNEGIGPLRWTASATVLSGADWLSLSPTAGVVGLGPNELAIQVKAQGLPAGTYHGLVTVTSPDADNSPQSTVVVLDVNETGISVAPHVFPYGMIFVSPEGDSAAPQDLIIINPSSSTVTFNLFTTFQGGVPWLAPSITNGSLAPGESRVVQLRPATPALPAAIYRAELAIRFGQEAPQLLDLAAVVVRAPAATAKQHAVAGCTPQSLVAVFRQPGASFRVNAAWPTPIEILAIDNCGDPVAKGKAVVSFSTSDPPLNLISNGDGRWSATWSSANRGSTVSLTARIETLAEPVLTTQIRLSGQTQTGESQPRVDPDGVVSSAGKRPGPLAPGSLFSLTGTRLAASSQQASTLPLPPALGETRVFIGGRITPIREIAENRIEGQVPVELPSNVRHQVLVSRGSVYANPVEILVSDVSPSIFVLNESTNQAAAYIVRADGTSSLVDYLRPARGGETISILATGLGLTDPVVPTGYGAISEANVAGVVKVFVDEIEAESLGARLLPGMVGVYSVQARLPDSINTNASARLAVQVNGIESTPAVIPTDKAQ